ncbi:hypothetical protein RF11_15580 [Thelohanellus kitauei]|uniref:PPM-type phosphatase domain-containing protein n=1 Tax=Thelohanellus kitauei TaxID=669202 RepID=A0A0C2I7W2_THEKT|nr:hypothetical protein RF11_15580 [Thelohanellus kitauei]
MITGAEERCGQSSTFLDLGQKSNPKGEWTYVNDIALFTDRPPLSYFGVYNDKNESHTSHFLAIFARWYISFYLATYLEDSETYDIQTLLDVIKSSILKLNKINVSRYPIANSGSSILVCIRIENHLLVTYMGDSAMYIVKNDGKYISGTPNANRFVSLVEVGKVTVIHPNLITLQEGSYRIVERTVFPYFRDSSLKQDIYEPDVFSYEIQQSDSYLILGSNNFFEVSKIDRISQLSAFSNPEKFLEMFKRFFNENDLKNTTGFLIKLNNDA